MTIGGAVSILGTNSNTVLAGPRYLWALAKDGFGPRALASLHPRFRTPWIAVLAQTAIALPLAFSGSFEALATLSAVARLATYFGTALAVPVLRRKFARVAAVRLPGGPHDSRLRRRCCASSSQPAPRGKTSWLAPSPWRWAG